MSDQVPHETKIERMERLVEVVQQIAYSGTLTRGWCRAGSRRGTHPYRRDVLRGRTRRNTTVNFNLLNSAGEAPVVGRFVDVLIGEATSTTLRGTANALAAA